MSFGNGTGPLNIGRGRDNRFRLFDESLYKEPFGKGFGKKKEHGDKYQWRKKLLMMLGFDNERAFLEFYKKVLEIHLEEVENILKEYEKEEE